MSALEHLSEDERNRLDLLYRYGQVGRCVNSVTHDVNNFLGAILAYAELIQMDGSLTEENERMLTQMIGAVTKSSNLLNTLTDIARRPRKDVRMMNPFQLVQRVLELRAYDLRVAGVKVESDLSDEQLSMMMDLPKLQQAIIYLVSNAMEELREREESLLKIKGTFADQERAVLTLWNAGPPIPEDLRERVFAPFFTTRGPEHIGLGLTIARDVAREHDGELTYDPDRGFTMELPLRNGLSDDGDRRPAGA